ncbi:hypothetical protein CYMTET_4930 [Cymbomonas tetramitiformis]|uniref:Uncharacterized protein n=1 Tax=Cymbomonas tetramitiformis TaxID=36881 RepID=A0AAE0LJK0_9CHLO|nr:hypothetical protein CYMTET_4930 [Cymbomonas tetramitiformis]
MRGFSVFFSLSILHALGWQRCISALVEPSSSESLDDQNCPTQMDKPFVQCDRSPPCIHTSYVFPTHIWDFCKTYNDSDWPTREPHLRRISGLRTYTQVANVLAERVVAFLGDSVMSETFNGFVCGFSREGLAAKEDFFWHIEGAVLPHLIVIRFAMRFRGPCLLVFLELAG